MKVRATDLALNDYDITVATLPTLQRIIFTECAAKALQPYDVIRMVRLRPGYEHLHEKWVIKALMRLLGDNLLEVVHVQE